MIKIALYPIIPNKGSMKRRGIGKIRGLQQIANSDGIFIICAMDHRGSLRNMISDKRPREVSYEEMVGRKIELCSYLAESVSAVLLDPIFGAAQCISHSILPNNTGLLVSIEASGYDANKDRRLTKLLDGWNVGKIRRMGASAVKILVYYRPDLEQVATQQLNMVDEVAMECIKYDLPFLVEPKSYPIGNEINTPLEFAALKERLVIKTAQDVTNHPIDVLKVEFPADLLYRKGRAQLTELCQQLDASSRVPWVILSAGVDFETFCQQVEIACQAGASGFLGGRAIWQEAMHIDNAQERVQYLSTTGTDRLKRLTEIANKHAVPWYKKLRLSAHELTPISERWYQEY